MNNDKKNKEDFISDLTVKDFIELSKVLIQSDVNEFVYGYKELAEFLNCSNSKVRKLVKSGKIDSAIYKAEGLIFFDKKKVLDALKVIKE